MKHYLAAPAASLVASLVTFGRLAMLNVRYTLRGIGPMSGGSIIDYLFGHEGTLNADLSLQLMFASMILWILVFSIVWLILSVILHDRPTTLLTSSPSVRVTPPTDGGE